MTETPPEVTEFDEWDDDGTDEPLSVKSCMDDICRNTGQCMWECWRELRIDKGWATTDKENQ